MTNAMDNSPQSTLIVDMMFNPPCSIVIQPKILGKDSIWCNPPYFGILHPEIVWQICFNYLLTSIKYLTATQMGKSAGSWSLSIFVHNVFREVVSVFLTLETCHYSSKPHNQ